MSTHEPEPTGVPAAAPADPPPAGGGAPPSPSSRLARGGRVFAVAALLSCVLAGMLLAFALPAVHGGPDRLAVGAVQGQGLPAPEAGGAGGEGADAPFEVRAYPDEAALRQAVRDREVNGGLAADARGLTVYTASAGGAPAAAVLTAVGRTAAADRDVPVTVRDLVPYPAGDPQGSGLAAAALPMVIGGVLPAFAFLRLFPGRAGLGTRLVGAALFSLLAGLAVAAVLRHVTGSLAGDFLLPGLGVGLGMAALSLTFLGLEALLGLPGLGAGVALMMFVGNPLSGLVTGAEWLPAGWGTLGQLLPPGASAALLRSLAYFDGTGAARPLLVLVGWILLGTLLSLLATRRHPAPARPTTPPA